MSALRLLSPRTLVGALLLAFICIVLSPTAARAAATATTTTLAITSSTGTVSSVAAGSAVSLTATVKAGATLVPAGSVYFCDASAAHCTDIHRIGTGQLGTSGTAVLKLIPGPGLHSYKAEFAGTAADAPSNSAASSLTVNAAPTTTTIAQSGSAGNYNLKATVIGKGTVAGPTGKVSFLDTSASNAVLGSAALGTSIESFAWTTPQSPATAAEPQSIVAADFNGDGIPDLAVGTNGTAATKNLGVIDILVGKGDGTFLAAKSYTGLIGNQLIVAAPFVTGGPQDILAANNSTATTNNGLLFLGDGKGGLGTPTTLSLGIDTITSVITGDFNADGKMDFVVAGQAFGVPAFNVFLGKGNGTFNSGTLNATSDVAITALGTGDFTGQGYLDIAVVHSDGTVDIFLQDGAGDFYPNAGTMAGTSPTAIAIGDFNGDGKADLAITNSTQDNVSILLGKGDGTFTAAASPVTGSVPKAIALADFNDDGFPDLAIADSSAESVTILLGKGDGTFTVEPVLNTGNTPIALATGRWNGENTGGIAVANLDPASAGSAGTATILLAERTETATASASNIAPTAAGAHLVDASYPGDTTYHASVSAPTSLSGSAKQAAAPILSPAAGTYSTAQTITLTDATTGAVLYYTTNGATPTTASTKYTSAISVTATETIKAVAVATGYSNSAVASATYTIQAAKLTVSVTPASLVFPSTAVSATSAAQTVTVKNTGTAAVSLTSETITGTNPKSFVISAKTCATTLASAATCTISIEFQPALVGALKADLSIADNATGSPQLVALAGTSTAASTLAVSVTPASLSFPSTAVSATSVAQTVTVKNTGTAVVNLTSETITGTNPKSFVISAKTCGATLAPAATCTISIEFQPALVGALKADLSIADNATGSPQLIALGGTSTAAETAAAAPTFSIAAGTYMAAQSVKLADATSGAMIYYTTNGTAPTTASTRYSAAITVSASETIKAIAAATGHTNSAVASAAYTISSPGGSVTATPSSITFPFTNIDTSSPVQIVTFKNTSTTAITSLSIALTGTSATSYSKTQTCGAALASGASCTVSLTFTPRTDGTFAATLQLTGMGASMAVSLSGTCGDPTSIAPDANTYVFDTTEGNIYVELRPDVAPKNVANFLYYVNNGTYAKSIMHRVVAGFINQGGGYKLNSDGQIIAPTTASPVVNEFKLSNVRGTIAMAKLSNDPNSATDQFFFNAADNSSTLDGQDGGYTVIGQIVGVQGVDIGSASESLAVMDAMNAVPTFAFQAPFDSIPLINYTSGETVTPSSYVYVNSIAHYTAKTDGPATPIFSINTGTYAGPQTVSLTDSTAGASIYYYLFGGSATTATKYTGPFTVSTSQYVVAYATAPGFSAESYYNYEYYDIVSNSTTKELREQ